MLIYRHYYEDLLFEPVIHTFALSFMMIKYNSSHLAYNLAMLALYSIDITINTIL